MYFGAAKRRPKTDVMRHVRLKAQFWCAFFDLSEDGTLQKLETREMESRVDFGRVSHLTQIDMTKARDIIEL